jgi:ArsR family transcriptional regulator, arsenate/arsenite/antimonite-responsive transcriptional repressor
MLNKKQEFESGLIEFAEFAKVLSHPARLAILKTLAEKKMCICGEIVEVLPLAQSTVSQHLKELKNMGLIRGEIEGVKSCYCLDWERLDYFFNIFQTELSELKKFQSDCKTC